MSATRPATDARELAASMRRALPLLRTLQSAAKGHDPNDVFAAATMLTCYLAARVGVTPEDFAAYVRQQFTIARGAVSKDVDGMVTELKAGGPR